MQDTMTEKELYKWAGKIISMLRNESNNSMTYEKVQQILTHTSEQIRTKMPLWYKEGS